MCVALVSLNANYTHWVIYWVQFKASHCDSFNLWYWYFIWIGLKKKKKKIKSDLKINRTSYMKSLPRDAHVLCVCTQTLEGRKKNKNKTAKQNNFIYNNLNKLSCG